MLVGVLAFHGDFAEHLAVLASMNVPAIEVRTLEDLARVNRLIIPGGESTVMAKFLAMTGVGEEIQRRANLPLPLGEGRGERRSKNQQPLTLALSRGEREQGKPLAIYGTCAGSILLAKTVTGKHAPQTLGLMDIAIERNAYGTQRESFEATIRVQVHCRGTHAASAVKVDVAFIRAPIITSVGEDVEVLATHGGHPVLVRQGRLLAGTFHPEARGEKAIHELFLRLTN